jgi:hypothetical protein
MPVRSLTGGEWHFHPSHARRGPLPLGSSPLPGFACRSLGTPEAALRPSPAHWCCSRTRSDRCSTQPSFRLLPGKLPQVVAGLHPVGAATAECKCEVEYNNDETTMLRRTPRFMRFLFRLSGSLELSTKYAESQSTRAECDGHERIRTRIPLKAEDSACRACSVA